MTSALFRYTARSEKGQLVTGSMAAPSTREALARLRARGLFVTDLASGGTKGVLLSAFGIGIPKRGAVASCLRSMAVLVGAGIALRRALAAAIEQCTDKNMGEALRAVAADLDGGASLSEAMQDRPREFSAQVQALIGAGELGGSLDDALAQAAALLERDEALKKKIAATVAYPAFVLCAATALVVFLVVVTVPAFETVLTQLHAELPLTTRAMLGLSDELRRPLTLIVSGVAIGMTVSIVLALRRTPRVRAWLDARILRGPLIGAVQRAANIACFCRTLGTLLHCGVASSSAARTASGAVTNVAYRHETAEIARELRTGTTLSKLLGQSLLFDAMTVQLVSAGEESGSLDSMLVRAAEYKEQQVEHALTVITAVLEPALICILGALIGTIVASVVVPLYSAIGNIR